MLSENSMIQFSRFASPQVYKASAHHIMGCEWLTINKEGKSAVMTTCEGSAPSPPDFMLMGFGACMGSGVKFLLDKNGKKFTKLTVDVEGEWTMKPQRRMGAIRATIKTDAQCDPEKLKEFVKLVEEKMCPVSGTLRTAPSISMDVKIL